MAHTHTLLPRSMPGGAETDRIAAAAQTARMQQLATATGFYAAYFALLGQHPCPADAFAALNAEYHAFFGEYCYPDYGSFRSANNV